MNDDDGLRYKNKGNSELLDFLPSSPGESWIVAAVLGTTQGFLTIAVGASPGLLSILRSRRQHEISAR